MTKDKIAYLEDHITGYKNYLHKFGWERGFKLKGKWHGEYESMGTIFENRVFFYTKGIFKEGIKNGKWLNIFVWIDGRLPTKATAGRYDNGLKQGKWSVYSHQGNRQEFNYEKGKKLSD